MRVSTSDVPTNPLANLRTRSRVRKPNNDNDSVELRSGHEE